MFLKRMIYNQQAFEKNIHVLAAVLSFVRCNIYVALFVILLV
jgi:hypothetical protein